MKRLLQALCSLGVLCHCAMVSAQAQDTLRTEFAFEIKAQLADVVQLGVTKDGTRRAIPIIGGSFQGAGIAGEVIAGGADYQLVRPDGVIELNAIYMIRTDDGAVINVENRGIINVSDAGVYFRTSPKFAAPVGPYDWLNKHIFLSSVRAEPSQPGYVFIRVYKVL